MKRHNKKLLGLMIIIVTTFNVTSMNVQAAAKNMGNGVIFDATYYANTYADVKAVYGYDENALYNHYLQYGMQEGRSSYNSNEITKGTTITKDQFLNKTGKQMEVNYVDLSKENGNALSFDETIGRMRELFPTGTEWNDVYHYNWAGYHNDNSIWYGSWGCASFVCLVSDEVYGNTQAHLLDKATMPQKGDITVLNGGQHQAFVLSVDANNRTITVVEGNMNGAVCWDSVFSMNDIYSVIRRY